MGSYTIKDLENLTGIQAHTLRIWEKRYGVVAPARTGTNRRMYTDEDLKRLINISILNRRGYKISKIVGMDEETLSELVRSLNESSGPGENSIEALILAMVDYDEITFLTVINRLTEESGTRAAWEGTIFPFLIRTGTLWMTGSVDPGQEHFVTNLLRMKLLSEIDRITADGVGGETIIFFLPENELHEIPLLYFARLAVGMGFRILYFGQMMPLGPVGEAASRVGSKLVVTGMSTMISGLDPGEYLGQLASTLKGSDIIVSGLLADTKGRVPANISRIRDAGSFVSYLEKRIAY